jgi:RNA polymerase sigma-70 factor (ECF subfamily)
LKITPIRAEAPAESDELVCRVLLASLDALYATAYRLTSAADVAEDLVQEAAKKALKARPLLKDERSARAWLFRILINAVRDHFRRHRVWEDLEPAVEELDTPVDLESVTRATAQDVRAALGQLKPSSRVIVILVDVEEFTLAEASEMLKVPIGTIASRLSRARAELRKLLSAYESKSTQRRGGL